MSPEELLNLLFDNKVEAEIEQDPRLLQHRQQEVDLVAALRAEKEVHRQDFVYVADRNAGA